MLELRPLCDLHVALAAPLELGDAPGGRRRVIGITGGTVSGTRMTGVILPGGADWQTIHADGTARLEARYTLKLADGALVDVINIGVRHGPPEVLAALARGETVDPGLYTMRTQPRFETGARDWFWLNRVVAVAGGRRDPAAVFLSVYEVL
jgi:hypothetical protein